MELRDYQNEAIEAIRNEWKDHNRTLLVLPTGCGKTIVFSKVAQARAKLGRVLILAHRDELLDQAADKLRKSFGVESCKEKAAESCIGRAEPVVVGSVQTLQSLRRLEKFPRGYFQTIIVDEAHHAVSESYKRVLEHFDGAKVLGVTATPDRGDMKNLGEFFESLAYEYSLRDAINNGYLSPIRVKTMPLEIDMSNVKVSAGDYQLDEVGNALEPYLDGIAKEMAKECKGKHTVVFLPLVRISQKFRDILHKYGLRAGEVNGESKNRDEVLKDFENGKYDVLCNSMLLTEGWDCPIVDCIVVLRPTKVRALYCQMIGRGTRLAEGKDHLLVLDFLWMTGKHRLMHPADILCKKEETADAVTKAIEEAADGADLIAIERDVEEERKRALAKALAEMEAKANRKKKKLIDPLDFELSIDSTDFSDYVPAFGWESEEASEKQVAYLENLQIDAHGLNKGQAKLLIDNCKKRMDAGLATPRQIKLLRRSGFRHVPEWTKEEASKIIGILSVSNWQPWKAHIVPGVYVPESLQGKYGRYLLND